MYISDNKEISIDHWPIFRFIIAIYLQDRSLEEIEFVLSHMDTIKTVVTYNSKMNDVLSQKYIDVEFY